MTFPESTISYLDFKSSISDILQENNAPSLVKDRLEEKHHEILGDRAFVAPEMTYHERRRYIEQERLLRALDRVQIDFPDSDHWKIAVNQFLTRLKWKWSMLHA